MNDQTTDLSAWAVCPKVRWLGQPIGLGIPLTLAGGFLTFNMILALNPEEYWTLQLATVLLVLVFGIMFLTGVDYLLMPLQRIWISRTEVQLRLGPLVLRRIPSEQIRSVSATTREILMRNRECDLYRIKLNCNGIWPKSRTLWLDWSIATEDKLRGKLTKTIFLL